MTWQESEEMQRKREELLKKREWLRSMTYEERAEALRRKIESKGAARREQMLKDLEFEAELDSMEMRADDDERRWRRFNGELMSFPEANKRWNG